MDGSPPPFVIQFKPSVITAEAAYEQALVLTALVDKLVELPGLARFPLRNMLDKHATQVALLLGRAAAETAPAARRKLFRQARPLVVECATILDIFDRRASGDVELVADARTSTKALVDALDQLAAR